MMPTLAVVVLLIGGLPVATNSFVVATKSLSPANARAGVPDTPDASIAGPNAIVACAPVVTVVPPAVAPAFDASS